MNAKWKSAGIEAGELFNDLPEARPALRVSRYDSGIRKL